ncbi:MAG: 50S ribosomal protein L9 [Candidatus Taylorbacteria bacterium RIFCSPLOWO2_01_FULL_44_26]|uniref:Large ribosomal subunit protein bL9 n=2 Tax=Candidatus Tayloriibacteriota TaxID=1817919 RepID=A0A1G2MLQ4_9BACT|nr:MAG: 50S ribosomal protein L9 [Candidatus Taylorbacteria bacterium RIFCSPHIGHO2_02_FULL_44_12]OHA31425.1 MAG: 50S ribosomal protein L9 [Candidatus Taylorbacteria bacterium RIFCSPLOWO2_01_FULL_44_26]
MKIILLQDIVGLGRKNDVKNVSDGYAQNFLIPRGMAVAATEVALKHLENKKAREENEKRIQQDLAIKVIKDLDGKSITIKTKADQRGGLFAGIHSQDIASELESQFRLVIDPKNIILKHPIKNLGEHTIDVKGAGKSARFTLVVEESE